jgi:arsenite methyltransferase
MKAENKKSENIRREVRERYGKIAENQGSCGGPVSNVSCCEPQGGILENLSRAVGYSKAEIDRVPTGADMGLGCGNPQAIAALKPGETVLDLGSGGGFDCFLAARAVGPAGWVIGVDMTGEMLTKARDNAKKSGFENVEFRKGEIENLPVENDEVDVVISNCVINLSPDKADVFKETFRVLKPGGRLAISDVVALKPLPENLTTDPELRCACIGGAALVADLESMLREVGFSDIRIEPVGQSREFIKTWVPGSDAEQFVTSATIEAVKPHTLPAKKNTERSAIPSGARWPGEMRERTISYIKKYDSCTQSILWAFMEDLGIEDPMVLRASGAMQGGMMSSLTCGVHTAGLMILGLLVGREDITTGLDGMMPIVVPAQDLIRRLNKRLGGHSCLEMTGVDFTDLEAALNYKLSADHDKCVGKVGDGAEEIAMFLQELDRKGELFRANP